jgi:AbiU2
MTIDPETEFKSELEVFCNEVEEAIQSFYAEQTIHNLARRKSNVYHALNRNAAFWKLTSRALQANALIVLGRIFDKDSRTHSIRRLLNLAANHPEIFSTAALEKRKRAQAGQWTDELMRTAYVPTMRDFARLQAYSDKQSVIYSGQYKMLRDKFFAHKERRDMTGAFASADIRPLERLLIFLSRLQDALWHLFWNGIKPVLRPARYSGRSILKVPEGSRRSGPTQEWITTETEKFLKYVSASYERDIEERRKSDPRFLGLTPAQFRGERNARSRAKTA